MIYKFIGYDYSTMEVELSKNGKVLISVDTGLKNSVKSFINLEKDGVYNLIGALHTLKAKM